MIPEVDFQVHEILFQAFFFPKIYGADREKANQDMNNFIELFKKHEEKILTLIEKFSGFSWTKEKIPVFLIPQNVRVPYSFAKFKLETDLPGVVQKFKLGQYRDLHIFIHELAHVNQMQSEFYSEKYHIVDKYSNRDGAFVELAADLVTLHVVRVIFGQDSEYERDFWDFLKNTNDKNKKKYEEIEKYKERWDLNIKPLRHYIEI